MRKLSEMRVDLNRISGEKERLAYFEALVREFDKDDALNDRKHFRPERRDDFDMTILDQSNEVRIPIPKDLTMLYTSEEWIDFIYSRMPEDLHELVTDDVLIGALRRLNTKRKEALFYRVVHGYSAEQIGAYRGVSGRNIRKLYDKAIQEIWIAIDKQAKCN